MIPGADASPCSIGVCGLGSAALRAHLPALGAAEDAGAVAITAVCDPHPDRRRAAMARLPRARGHATLDELLGGGPPALLVVASPPSAHLGAILPALRAGADVLCEKPLGLDDAEVGRLGRALAEHPGRLCATVSQYRLAPAARAVVRTARRSLSEGRRVELRVEVERPGTDPLSAGGWRARGDAEGGILGDHAVHYLGMLWDTDPRWRVVAAQRTGEPGHESATLELAAADVGRASIAVSYAGRTRRNLVELHRPDDGTTMSWADGELRLARSSRARARSTGALSARGYVDSLYRTMYSELLTRFEDDDWRARQNRATLGVAALLAAGLAAVRR